MSTITSIYIPRMSSVHDEDCVIREFKNQQIGQVSRVDFVPINKKPGFILQNSYENILKYLNEPFDKNLKGTYNNLKMLDERRNINSEMVFPKLYKEFFH